MPPYAFKDTLIDQHIVRIAFIVMPPIEIKTESTHLFDFGRELKDKYPDLFESLVESPTEFSIRKVFTFVSKGEIEQKTISIAQQGMELAFPLKLSVFQDVEISKIPDDSIIINIVKLFKKYIRNKNILRVGYIDERYYSTSQEPSVHLIRNRFTHVESMSDDGEIFLRFNLCNDNYNRVVSIESVAKKSLSSSNQTGPIVGHGIKVVIDFNNRTVGNNLNDDEIIAIIANAKAYIKGELPDFLNQPESE